MIQFQKPDDEANLPAATAEIRSEPVKPFDYSGMTDKEADALRSAADDVRRLHRRIRNTYLEIGGKLAAAKAKLGHGQFGAWIAAEFTPYFELTDRTARNYIAAFETFGAKSEIVSELPQDIVYRLAASPEPIRAKVLRQWADGLPAPRVRDALADELAAEKAAKADARKTPEQRKKDRAKAARAARENDKHREEWAARDAERKAANSKAAVMLVEALGDKLPAIIAILKGTDFANLADWLEMPHGWTHSGFNRVPNPPPPGS